MVSCEIHIAYFHDDRVKHFIYRSAIIFDLFSVLIDHFLRSSVLEDNDIR